MVAINMELPKTCGKCPFCIYTAEEKKAIGYCNTSDEDYYCKALDRFMEYDKVDGGVDILGKPSDCPLKEVPTAYWKEFSQGAYHGQDEYGEPIWRDVIVRHCSRCNRRTVIKENYCPNCGSRMVEEQQGENTDGKC